MINYICGILLIISAPVWACNNLITKDNADKAIAGDSSARAGCPEVEKCYCYDTIDWESADWKDEIVNGDPIYTVNSQSVCADEVACQLAMAELQCDIGFTAKYRLDIPQVFCERLNGYEQINTGEKILYNKESKQAAKAQRQVTKEQKSLERKARKDAAKQELSNIDWSQITTIAKMRQVLKAVVDKLEEEE